MIPSPKRSNPSSCQPTPRGQISVDDLTGYNNAKADEEEFRSFAKSLHSKYQPVTDGFGLSVHPPFERDSKHTTAAFERLQQTDHELFENMKKFKKDADINKLSVELCEANSLLAQLEQDVDNLKTQREKNLCSLNKVKHEHQILIDEKFHVQIKLNIARKGCQPHPNKHENKEIDQLIIDYEKLEHKEKGMRRRITMLEAELSLINSKLDPPRSEKRKVVVPRLDLSKLNTGGKKKVLPPLKNAPRAPRKGVNERSVAQENFTVFNTGQQWKENIPKPIPSSSTPVMQEKIARMIHPTANDMKCHPAWGTHQKQVRLPKTEQTNHMEEAVMSVNFKEKPVSSMKAGYKLLPDIVKGSQFMDKSKVVPKQGSKKPAHRRQPYYVQQKPSPYF